MKKVVNGEEIEMSSEEEEAIKAEWAANDPNNEKNKAKALAAESQEYLNNTDYLAIRAGAEAYPLDPSVAQKREQARENIRLYKNMETGK